MAQTERNINDRIPVWIIDDNKQFCVVLSEALNRSLSIVCERYFLFVRSSFKSLDEAENPPSVILLDIKMPGISGLDAIPMLKKFSPGSEIIMLTSYDDDDDVRTALQRGATGYLLKTSTPEDIIRAIEKVQEGGAPLDPFIAKRMIEEYQQGLQAEINYHLSKREKEIIQLFSEGLPIDEISQRLGLSVHTINTHRKNIYQKLGVHSRSTLTLKAYKEGILK